MEANGQKRWHLEEPGTFCLVCLTQRQVHVQLLTYFLINLLITFSFAAFLTGAVDGATLFLSF